MLLNEGLTPPLRGRPLPVQERKLSQCTHSRTNAAAASLSRPRPLWQCAIPGHTARMRRKGRSVSALCDGALAMPFFLWWPYPLSTCPKYWARMGIRRMDSSSGRFKSQQMAF